MARLLNRAPLLLPFLPAAVLTVILAGTGVPPSADLPRQLAYGQEILQHGPGAAPYPPLWPVTLALVRLASGGLEVFLSVARFLPVLPLLAITVAAGALGFVVAGRRAAVAVGAFAGADHAVWVAMAWGGHPQTLALAASIAAMAAWIHHRRGASPWPAAVLGALAWGFNPYAPFLLAPAVLYFAWQRPWLRPDRQGWIALLASHAVLGLVWLPAYATSAQTFTTGALTAVFSPWLVALALPFQLWTSWRLWTMGAAVASVAFLLPGARPSWSRHVLQAVAVMLTAAWVVQLATFTNLTGRVVHMLSMALAVLAGLVVAHKLPDLRSHAAVVVVLLLVVPIAASRAVEDVPYYSPLNAQEVAALADLPPGDVVVYAPLGDIDAAWIEAVQGVRAVEPRKDWRYWPSEDLEAARSAFHLAAGVAGFQDGRWSVIESGCTQQALTLHYDDGLAMRQVAAIPDGHIRVNDQPAWPRWETGIHEGAVKSRALLEGGALTREIRVQDGHVAVAWRSAEPFDLLVETDAVRNGVAWELRSNERAGRTTPAAALEAPNGTLVPSGIRFQSEEELVMRFSLEGLQDVPAAIWAEDLLGAGYDLVYARGPDRQRFAIASPGPLLVSGPEVDVYGIRAGTGCEATSS